MPELGIVDIREIIREVKTTFDYDFSNYALTSFKQRLERLMAQSNISGADTLIQRLRENSGFFDTFLYELSVPSTEMFRDPSLWRWLREDYFPAMMDRNPGRFRIWIPACVSGAELFSLTILLHESGWLDKVQITASCFSDKAIEAIKSGCYDLKKIEVSEENYKRFNGAKELSAYYKPDRTCVLRNTFLIDQVEFRKVTLNLDTAPTNIKLILFRNQMIYFNPTLQEKVLRMLYDSLSSTGHLITGIREKMPAISAGREYELINAAESVYRKRILV